MDKNERFEKESSFSMRKKLIINLLHYLSDRYNYHFQTDEDEKCQKIHKVMDETFDELDKKVKKLL